MIDERILPVGCEELRQFPALGRGETSTYANVLQGSLIIEQSEQQRTDVPLAGFVPAEPSHDAITITLVFDLEHHPLIRFVGSIPLLCDDAIQSGALEAAKPIRGNACLVGCGRDVDRWRRSGQNMFQLPPPLLKGFATEVAVALAEQVKEHHRCRRSLRKELYPGRRGMNT